MIWYCQKLYFPQIFFFSLFSPFDFLPHLKTQDFFPPPTRGGKTQLYTGLFWHKVWRSITASLDSLPDFVLISFLFSMTLHIARETPVSCFGSFECPFEEQRANSPRMSAEAKNRVGNTNSEIKLVRVKSNLSWCSLTCHGKVQLVMVHSDLSWCSSLVQLIMVQSNLSWCSPTCHGEIQFVMVHSDLSWCSTFVQLIMVQSFLSWCSLTCHGEVILVMVQFNM